MHDEQHAGTIVRARGDQTMGRMTVPDCCQGLERTFDAGVAHRDLEAYRSAGPVATTRLLPARVATAPRRVTGFGVYVHRTSAVEAVLRSAGFQRAWHTATFWWQVELWRRAQAAVVETGRAASAT